MGSDEDLAEELARRASYWYENVKHDLDDACGLPAVDSRVRLFADFVLRGEVSGVEQHHVRRGPRIVKEARVVVRLGRRSVRVVPESLAWDLFDALLRGSGLGRKRTDLSSYLLVMWQSDDRYDRLRTAVKAAAVHAAATGKSASPPDGERERLERTRSLQLRSRVERTLRAAVREGMSAEEMYELVGLAVVRPVMED